MAAATWWGEDIIPRIQWCVEIAEGECFPDGYGLAWRRWQTGRAVCMPMPLNLIVGALRACRDWIRGGFYASGFDPRFADAIQYGERRGYKLGASDVHESLIRVGARR